MYGAFHGIEGVLRKNVIDLTGFREFEKLAATPAMALGSKAMVMVTRMRNWTAKNCAALMVCSIGPPCVVEVDSFFDVRLTGRQGPLAPGGHQHPAR